MTEKTSAVASTTAKALATPKSQSTWALAWRRFRRHKLAIAASVVILLLVSMALFASLIAPYDPTAIPSDLVNSQFLPPSAEHWLGTDDLGRDVLSRIIYGSRISLLVGFIAAFTSVLIGTVLGILAGYFSGQSFNVYTGPFSRTANPEQPLFFASSATSKFSLTWLPLVPSWILFYLVLYGCGLIGWILVEPVVQRGFSSGAWDAGAFVGLVLLGITAVGAIWGLFGRISIDLDILISRWIDFMLTIPALPLNLVLSAFLRDPNTGFGQWAQQIFGESASVFIIISIITIFGWLTIARLVRGTILSLREQEFTAAAKALGSSESRVMFHHLLPNALTPIIVQTTLQVGGALLTEAALSFLGFGIQPPVATWGNMLTNAQNYIFNSPWLAFPPGVMILLTVLAFNYLGDGLRDALDPRSRR
ncbi:ABC transporter permease [Candidatus Acetothermia bacterium]|nr:ABC transporter permease [Candidatus Acetothermia bacterium]MBI3460337.1 ABC transporter permease [Candidatus Acetothermia bacterium]